MVSIIENTLDFFYPPFRRLMNRQTFRYAACGSGNTVLDIFLFFISYNFIAKKQVVHIGFLSFEPHTAAFIMAFLVTFPIGFFLMRNIVFQGSTIRGRIQLLRYFITVTISVFLNYIFIKLFVEQFHIFPTLAKILTTFIVVGFSYMSQRYFTFKVSSAG
jgi:putative flippase GtrA